MERRGLRLVLFGAFVALIYPAGRLLWLGIIALGYFWPLVDAVLETWRTSSVRAGYESLKDRLPYFTAVLVALLLMSVLFTWAQWDLYQVRLAFDRFRENAVVSSLSLDRLVPYRGRSRGLRGPVIVDVRFAGGRIYDEKITKNRIDGITIVEHSDSISVGRSGMQSMARRLYEASKEGKNLARVDAVSGATYSSLALREAVLDALWKARGQRKLGIVSRALFSLIGLELNRFLFSASAVIFIVGLFFEFCLAPFMHADQGVTLPCYNCQTCVGVCPVKMVDGEPYPMSMVLAARLGDFNKVKNLSRWCVGCSRCSASCPVGISGPMVAALGVKMSKAEGGGGKLGND